MPLTIAAMNKKIVTAYIDGIDKKFRKNNPGITRAEIITALRCGADKRRREADALEAEVCLRLAQVE
jgi:hypothetical protein